MEHLTIAGKEFSSRLFIGTGKFSSNKLMSDAIDASGAQMVTMAMKRIDLIGDNVSTDVTADDADTNDGNMLRHIMHTGVQLLPNTSGTRDADEAVFAAKMAREAFGTNWIKLEIHPDPRYLLPDPVETLRATERLVREGFVVLPYCQADPVICKRLAEAGAATVMPLASPIGTNKGLRTLDFLSIIISESTVPVVIDAGIGAPSDAAKAMEIGADAVLVNTAIAVADDPVAMARAFRIATEAGRMAYEAGLATEMSDMTAEASSPLTAFLN